jgi:2-polyprenyl-3-methyl-5-hydroxy-6-metoxy-1,4-benzoquinol methylase
MRALDRSDEVEWLEAGRGSPADVAANLAEMWRINARFGGLRALTLHLYPRLARSAGPLTVLDLGAGGADIPAAIGRWARRRALPLRVVALDRAARVLRVARSRLAGAPDVALLQADAVCLPLPAESVDWIISTLMLHHFPPAALTEMLRSAMRRARRGLVMSDLVRGRLPSLAFACLQPLLARNALTRHDGALSIRRAYTPAELHAIAMRAGLPRAAIHVHFPWRMTLVAER